jgi:ABC-2 type transport system permease protein
MSAINESQATAMSPRGAPVRTGRTVPSLQAVGITYGVIVRQLITRGRVIALTLLALVATVAGFALGRGDASLDDAVRLIGALGFAVVVPVVALVFGGASIGDLREDKTLVYFWLRPMNRWPIVVGAALAAMTVTAPVTLVPLLAAAILTGVGSDIVVGTLIAGVVGVIAYVCVFTMLGICLKKFIVWGLAYILIWEGFIAQAGSGVAQFALRKYTRSILVDRTGADLDLADFSLAVGVIVPLVVAVVALLVGAWRLGAQEID